MSNISSIDWQTWTNEQLDPIAKQLLMNRKTEWVLPFMLAYVPLHLALADGPHDLLPSSQSWYSCIRCHCHDL